MQEASPGAPVGARGQRAGWRSSADGARGRLAEAIRAAWPSGAAGRVLLGLIIFGVALRLLTIISWWPVTPTLDDAYQLYAKSNPFMDPQHPAGYGLIIAALGAVTREVAFPVLLQHLSGIASALLLWAATRRVTGSAWAGLLPAGIVLLNPDEIFLEHAIMSESWAILATSVGLYAAVRTFDEPMPWWRWPIVTGVALGLAVTIRTAGLLMVPVVVLALLLYQARSLHRLREHWRAPVAAAGAAAIILVAFAGANATFGQRFGIAPSPGWYLYGRVAQFADCHRFTPPAGTAVLCETRPASQRPSAYYYMFEPQAPAPRHIGDFGTKDSLVGAWAERALRAQFGDFLSTAWAYFRSYWVPGWLPARLKPTSNGLDPQLDFTYGNVFYAPAIRADLEAFYDHFTVHPVQEGLKLLRDWQLVARFGATALFVTTLLMLIGLAIGSRRSRVGVLMFGGGGVSLVVASALTGTYSGRYTVPMAGPMMAAAGIALTEVWRAWVTRRRRAEAEAPERMSAQAPPSLT